MRPVKLLFTAAFLMLWALLLACMDSGNYEFASYLAFGASAVFLAGLIDNGSKTPAKDDKLPQKRCPKCDRMHDFDYPKCPHCGHDYAAE